MTAWEEVDRIAQATGCSPAQVEEVAGLVLKALHRSAVCNDDMLDGMLRDCLLSFGEAACIHLGGILEEARLSGGDPDIPWSETILRMVRPVDESYGALFDGWLAPAPLRHPFGVRGRSCGGELRTRRSSG